MKKRKEDEIMLFRIIALDIDGTLTNSQKVITAKTRNQLIRFQKSGGKIILASGRPAQGIKSCAEILRLSQFGGYILAYNGGCVIECSSGSVVAKTPLPLEYIPEICDIIKDYPVGIITYEGDHIVAGNHINRYTELESSINHMDIKFTSDFSGYVNFDVPKCLLQGEPDVILKLEKILSEKYSGKLGIFKSEPYFLEIVPKNIDKAMTIDRLLKMIGYERDECIAFGDGFNDISMIRYVGLGIAMQNASETVKSAADYVTRSNDEDGIAFMLSKMGRSVFPSLAMI